MLVRTNGSFGIGEHMWTVRIAPIEISCHNNDVIMGAVASQITSLVIVYASAYSGTDQRKHQSSASLAFVRGIHRQPVNSPHKWPVTRKMFSFDDVIMFSWGQCRSPLITPDICILHIMYGLFFFLGKSSGHDTEKKTLGQTAIHFHFSRN